MKIQCLGPRSPSTTFLIKLRQISILLDSPLTIEVLHTSPSTHIDDDFRDALAAVGSSVSTSDLSENGYSVAVRNFASALNPLKLVNSAPSQLTKEKKQIKTEIIFETPNFEMVDISSIDFVLLSNYHQMLALPYLTEYTEFKGKIYATEPTVEFGKQLMEELVGYFGENSANNGHSTIGSNEINSKMRNIYTLQDVKACIDKIIAVRYREQVSLFDNFKISAFSSGYCLGGSNWLIESGYEKISLLGLSSIVSNMHPEPFDKAVLDSNVVLINNVQPSAPTITPGQRADEFCIYIAKTLKRGGNVLIPCSPTDIFYDLIEVLNDHLNNVGLGKIPIYLISPIANHSLHYSNICGEWMCLKRQEKMYLPENPLGHSDLIAQKRLLLYSDVNDEFGRAYRELCIVFAGHHSMLAGPAKRFMKLWAQNERNTVVFISTEFDYTRIVERFEPMRMSVIDNPIDIRMTATNILEHLRDRPRFIVLPSECRGPEVQELLNRHTVAFYKRDELIYVPAFSQFEKALVNEQLAMSVRMRDLGDTKVAPLSALLTLHNNNLQLTPLADPKAIKTERKECLWGEIQLSRLLSRFSEAGFEDLIVDKIEDRFRISILQDRAIVTIGGDSTKVETNDDELRSFLMKCIVGLLEAT
ncbi:uncharacterized protein VTP21DRAFT_1987 [Calcarisporiella thermophila]|uniref:uncharacterized protein n=1 Tax=Calcarisporiella thermophila TaxID=911321 RepID=UPI00374441B0